jgi:hypothetical protein
VQNVDLFLSVGKKTDTDLDENTDMEVKQMTVTMNGVTVTKQQSTSK